MSNHKAIATKSAPAAVGAYSQGIETEEFVFTSGQIPLHPENGTMPSDIKAQAAQALDNVQAVLAAAGLTMADVVKTTVLLADISDFAAVNEVYQGYFTAPYPARSCFAVAGIPKGASVEIEAIAKK